MVIVVMVLLVLALNEVVVMVVLVLTLNEVAVMVVMVVLVLHKMRWW